MLEYAPTQQPARKHFMTPSHYIQEQPDGVLLYVKVQPRSSVNEIGQPLGHELRIKVTAPPVDSAANEALVRLLAEALDVPRSQMQIVRGGASKHKTLKIAGITAQSAEEKLAPRTRKS